MDDELILLGGYRTALLKEVAVLVARLVTKMPKEAVVDAIKWCWALQVSVRQDNSLAPRCH